MVAARSLAIATVSAVCIQAAGHSAAPAEAAETTLLLTAKADLADGRGADVEVRVDGQVVGRLDVKSTSYADYAITLGAPVPSGAKVSVRFRNDYYRDGVDRNLYVQKIAVGSAQMRVADAGVSYDAGRTWQEVTDGQFLSRGLEFMPWNGAMHFTWPSEAKTFATEVVPAAEDAEPLPAAARPFGVNSFWYKPIPADAPVSPLAGKYVETLKGDLAAHGQATVNTTGYAPPIYMVDGNTPRRKVAHNRCTGPVSDPVWIADQWGRQFDSVPIPDEALPASGSDGEIVIWSPSTNEVWEMWQFRRDGGNLSACWGGKLSGATSSDGVFARPFGVAASGLSLLGGTVRIEELKAGKINHAVAIGVNRPRSGVYSWPANRTDGTWDSDAAIPEGTRFRLDPSIDVDKMNISPIAKIIAKAGQEYGFIVRDNTTGPVVVYAEDASPYVRAGKENPYTQLFGEAQYKWMIGFPWDRIQAMPLDYGKP